MGKFTLKVDKSAVQERGENYTVYDGEMPPAGKPFRMKLKQLRVATSERSGNMMFKPGLEITEPAKKNGKPNPNVEFNGFYTMDTLTLTEASSSFVNRFIFALTGADENKYKKVHSDLWGAAGFRTTNDDSKMPDVSAIGTFKIPVGMELIVVGKHEKGDDGIWRFRPVSYLQAKDVVSSGPADDLEDDEDEEEFDDEPAEDEEADEYEDEEEDEPTEDDEEAARKAELEKLARPALLKVAKECEIRVKRGTAEADIIESILDYEFAAEEDEDADEEDEYEDDEEPEEEPEPEPEPVKPARRNRAKAAAAPAKASLPATRARKRRGSEPPF